ncbi:Dihydroorotate dehydrogenase (quinone) [Salinivirga cyanobacteriivorans]|uniref:Dihydroorotate dehydrogenase (quinone) n=1 Tax=Salinivirga cyanobacteriivorans TaxID=1307839 RepID=A0A0S2HUE3_9BACT|nr:quinone-dependent dihydroorotate dehydrogenase [Salinivirga cyanobacteriivorans]ALO13696.1 Dihydroorotate dehydrogenase (quinone) [Salinivirga cyanobacteriivorans]
MYTSVIRPLLFKFNPENAHWLTFQALKLLQSIPFGPATLLSFMQPVEDPVNLMGLTFRNRVGVAAGLDKNAELLPIWKSLGFGFAEIGTVTPLGQPGNPRPRLFRLPDDKALINRMGFNNDGLDIIQERLKNRPKDYIVGGNLGKNTATPNEQALKDYLRVFSGLYNLVDYLVINVSCPNISDLDKLQDRKELDTILKAIMERRNQMVIQKPVLLKVSPDLNDHQLMDTLQLVADHRVDGIIATNTSIGRVGLSATKKRINQIGNGGLSGLPISERSTQIIALVKKELGNDYPVIGSGGIVNEAQAKAKLDSGADLLQLYTGFIYQGISLIKHCLQV